MRFSWIWVFCVLIREMWVCVLVLHKCDFVAWDVKPPLFRLSEELTFVQCEFGVADECARSIVTLWRDILSLRRAKSEHRIKEKKSLPFSFSSLLSHLPHHWNPPLFSQRWGVESVDAVRVLRLPQDVDFIIWGTTETDVKLDSGKEVDKGGEGDGERTNLVVKRGLADEVGFVDEANDGGGAAEKAVLLFAS